MEDYRYDRPSDYDDPRSGSRSTGWLLAALVLVLAGAGVYFWLEREPKAPVRVAVEPPAEAAPQQPDKPAIQHPAPQAEPDPEKPLPELDKSDPRLGEVVSGLIGAEAFKSFVVPQELVRRIVATVDNLPRRMAPMKTRPVQAVPGQFLPGEKNRARYAKHVKVFEAIDARALVQAYARLYPLFQAAYADLGYPDRYFNDRLVEAIDDLLAAPNLNAVPDLAQPKVLYEYADRALEGRSAGQKIMMRLGGDNAAKVKAKLREIRKELTGAALPG